MCYATGSRRIFTSAKAISFHLVAFSAALSTVQACPRRLPSFAAAKLTARSFDKRCKKWTGLREEGGT